MTQIQVKKEKFHRFSVWLKFLHNIHTALSITCRYYFSRLEMVTFSRNKHKGAPLRPTKTELPVFCKSWLDYSLYLSLDTVNLKRQNTRLLRVAVKYRRHKSTILLSLCCSLSIFLSYLLKSFSIWVCWRERTSIHFSCFTNFLSRVAFSCTHDRRSLMQPWFLQRVPMTGSISSVASFTRNRLVK